MKRRGRPRIPGTRRRPRFVSSAIRRRWCCWMGVRLVLPADIRSAGSGFARTSYAAFRGAPSILAHLMCAPGSRRLQSLAYEPLAVPFAIIFMVPKNIGVGYMAKRQKPGETPNRPGEYRERGSRGGKVQNPREVTIEP